MTVCACGVGGVDLKCISSPWPVSAWTWHLTVKKAEQWDTVSVTLPVNNPSMPLVLSFPANDSRPLQSRQEIALFYGMEKKEEIKRGAGEREKKKGDGGLKKVLQGTWCK